MLINHAASSRCPMQYVWYDKTFDWFLESKRWSHPYLFFFFYCFLIFSLSNKQTNKTTKCKVIVMHHFLGYFYSLDMEVFVIYDFITQTTYTITYMQMETLKYMLLENLQFTLERQGQGDSLQILLLKGTKTHKFQNANPEDISLPHPNSCVLPSAL